MLQEFSKKDFDMSIYKKLIFSANFQSEYWLLRSILKMNVQLKNILVRLYCQQTGEPFGPAALRVVNKFLEGFEKLEDTEDFKWKFDVQDHVCKGCDSCVFTGEELKVTFQLCM